MVVYQRVAISRHDMPFFFNEPCQLFWWCSKQDPFRFFMSLRAFQNSPFMQGVRKTEAWIPGYSKRFGGRNMFGQFFFWVWGWLTHGCLCVVCSCHVHKDYLSKTKGVLVRCFVVFFYILMPWEVKLQLAIETWWRCLKIPNKHLVVHSKIKQFSVALPGEYHHFLRWFTKHILFAWKHHLSRILHFGEAVLVPLCQDFTVEVLIAPSQCSW